MNKIGSDEENTQERLVGRNLRQRAILLSLFATLLLLISICSFFHPVDFKTPAVLSLRQGRQEASWHLMLVPQRPRSAEDSTFSLAGSSTAGAILANDCSIPSEFAPFFALAMDINRAQAKDLALLPDIGPVLGQRIVAEREQNGPFSSPQALLRVTGIGPHTFARLAPHICTR